MLPTDFLNNFLSLNIDYIHMDAKESFLSNDAIREVARLVYFSHEVHNTCCLDCMDSGISEYVGKDYVNKSGKFVKRLAKYLSERYDYKLTNTLAGHIGEAIRQDMLEKREYYCKVTNQFNWEPGTFGSQEENSCFWGGKALARRIIREVGGIAIQVFDSNGRGVGRCWALPIPGTLDIGLINIYGDINAEVAANVLNHLSNDPANTYLPSSLYECPAKNNGTDSEVLWINPGHGNGICYVLPYNANEYHLELVDFGAVPKGYQACRRCGKIFQLVSSDSTIRLCCNCGNYTDECMDEEDDGEWEIDTTEDELFFTEWEA